MLLLLLLRLLSLLLFLFPVIGHPQGQPQPQPDFTPVRGRRRRDIQTEDRRVEDVEDRQYWMDLGRKELVSALGQTHNTGLARNVVLIIGDGMSLTTVASARVMKGQRQGRDGVSSSLVWERFPNLGLAKTYNVNSMVPDSAATASAMFTGVKTNFHTMGFDSGVVKGDVESMLNTPTLDTVLDWAQTGGMRTGLVTTVRVTHATPAALYAKTAQRRWECDQVMPRDSPEEAMDITRQLVHTQRGANIDVVLGGGLGSFLPKNYSRPGLSDYLPQGWEWECENGREDGRDLVEEWEGIHPGGRVVLTREELLSLPANTDSILGLFAKSFLPFEDEREEHPSVPSLTEMTTTALDLLKAKAGNKGFFLMVEGGKIDIANHNGEAVRALRETLALDEAVQAVLDRVDLSDTLVIVTADHSHTLSFGGYPDRRTDITGVSFNEHAGGVYLAEDGAPFPILSYGNGPGFYKLEVRNVTTEGEGEMDTREGGWRHVRRAGGLGVGEAAHPGHVYPGAVPLKRETHGGDDVGVWVAGPWGHLIHTTHEQSYIGHVISYAACIGLYRGEERCDGSREGEE